MGAILTLIDMVSKRFTILRVGAREGVLSCDIG